MINLHDQKMVSIFKNRLTIGIPSGDNGDSS